MQSVPCVYMTFTLVHVYLWHSQLYTCTYDSHTGTCVHVIRRWYMCTYGIQRWYMCAYDIHSVTYVQMIFTLLHAHILYLQGMLTTEVQWKNENKNHAH